MTKTIFLLLIGSLLAACANQPIDLRSDLQPFPIKIGVLADTQVTTSREKFQSGVLTSFRSPEDDNFAGVALRPPALEYLAPSILSHLLDKLVQEKVDLILYLGDAANSGCKDELHKVFSVLAKVRDNHKIPTYFVIGNHDYLGTGNQTNKKVRNDLCNTDGNGNQNPAESKIELIARTHSHNNASAAIDKKFHYRASDTDFSHVVDNSTCENSHYFSYYAAALVPMDREITPVDILLADSSDYNNVWFRPSLGIRNITGACELLAGWGLKGSMSAKQILNLQELACESPASCNPEAIPKYNIDYRLIASHYDPLSFNARFPWEFSPSFVRDNLGWLLSDGNNIWLGAHHHYLRPAVSDFPVGMSVRRGPRGNFSLFSVGSTTDLFPHVAIVEAANVANRTVTNQVGFRQIFAPSETEACEGVFSHIADNMSELSPVQCEIQYTKLSSILGIDPIYRSEGCWNEAVYATVRANIDAVLTTFPTEEISEANARLCLAIASTVAEGLVNVPD
ncbi:MAG: metallophosphoesterase [Pseudohongiellaceae bacterium]